MEFFPRDPLAKIEGAVPKPDAVPSRASEELDGLAVDELHLPEVERDRAAALSVLIDQPPQFFDVLTLDAAAEGEPHFTGFDGPLDLEHLELSRERGEMERAKDAPPSTSGKVDVS